MIFAFLLVGIFFEAKSLFGKSCEMHREKVPYVKVLSKLLCPTEIITADSCIYRKHGNLKSLSDGFGVAKYCLLIVFCFSDFLRRRLVGPMPIVQVAGVENLTPRYSNAKRHSHIGR